MQKVLTAEEMREVDRQTTERYGIPSILLMENAAHAAARVITEKLGGEIAGKSILILCGKGSNGGDGAALARVLWTLGASVDIAIAANIEDTKDDARINFQTIKNFVEEGYNSIQGTTSSISDEVLYVGHNSKAAKIGICFPNYFRVFFDDYHNLISRDVIVDAFFGTGLTKPLEGEVKSLALIISSLKGQDKRPLILSLDLPSGLNADVAEPIGENFQADLTVTFTAPKLANVFPPASNFNGELVVANIGSPQELIDNSPSQTFVAEKQDAQNWLYKTRVKNDSYKKTRGTCLVVAGSKSYSGAAVLAANACFAAGAGMVSLGAPKSVQEIVAAKVSDEIITHGFAETKDGAFAENAAKDVLESSEKMNVLAIGCGLTSDGESTRKFVREVVENRKTSVVIDADGLNALAPFDLQGSNDLPIVLTPHIGEFQRLLGTKDELKDKIKAAREFAVKHNVILLLKGERSIVAAPDGTVVINPTGNAGIARAGSGDTLTGIVAGFLAQTFGVEKPNLENTFEAVVAALYVSGSAGDIAAEKFGQRFLSATDIRESLAQACQEIERGE